MIAYEETAKFLVIVFSVPVIHNTIALLEISVMRRTKYEPATM